MSDQTPTEAAEARARQASRNALRLRALVRSRWGIEADPSTIGAGAAIATGDRAFVLVDEERGLGAALAWSHRAGATELHLLTDARQGDLARQATLFRTPVTVWAVDGTELAPAVPTALPDGAGPPDAPELVALLESEGLGVVVEGDRLAGEFRGLEVARIVRAVDDGEPILEVGVGRFDRHLTALLHADLAGRDAIARVVEQLRAIRRPDGPNHPLATLVPERWLRWSVLEDPTVIGCEDLVAAPAAEPRDRLRVRGVAAAIGSRSGRPCVAVFTVGVDLESPVQAADTRAMLDPDAELVLVVPERDVLPSTRRMVDDIVGAATIEPIAGDWRR